MSGLRRICKLFGGMNVSSGCQTIRYVWDYAADEPVLEHEMPFGSERHAASERVRWMTPSERTSDSHSSITGSGA